jgi:hypothetical protein
MRRALAISTPAQFAVHARFGPTLVELWDKRLPFGGNEALCRLRPD